VRMWTGDGVIDTTGWERPGVERADLAQRPRGGAVTSAVSISLFLTVVWLLVFSFFFTHQHSSSSLQYSDYNLLILNFSLPISTNILDLTILEFIFDNKTTKIII
jgi:hypothetical protein